MNIDTMRNIDHYVGVPLCWIFSGINWLQSFLRPKELPRPSRVLFIELSEMGSAILADPCMRQVQRAGCEVFFLIFKKNQVSLRLLGTVPQENIFVMRESSIFLLLLDSLRLMFWCRRKKIDSTIDLELFSRVTSLLTWATQAGNRVGFHRYHQEGLYRGSFLTHRVPYNHQIHISHNFMNLVQSLLSGVSTDGFLKRTISIEDRKVSQAVVSESTRTRVLEKIRRRIPEWNVGKPLLLINANAGDFLPQRKWPKEYFVKLIQLLLKDQQELHILLTGAPTESDNNTWISSAVDNPRCVNFSGGVEFEELPALYNFAKVLLTNDSGPAHFSSVTPIRSFVFFGPETPSLYGSLGNSTAFYANLSCSPCVSATNHRKTLCSDNVCLKVIKPETVYAELVRAL